MRTQLEKIASEILNNIEDKPNYSNRDFINSLIIFQSALMDKMYDNQDYDKMNITQRHQMAESCGTQLHKLIHTFTGLDMHQLENFL